MRDRLRLAIPNKGRLLEATLALLHRSKGALNLATGEVRLKTSGQPTETPLWKT